MEGKFLMRRSWGNDETFIRVQDKVEEVSDVVSEGNNDSGVNDKNADVITPINEADESNDLSNGKDDTSFDATDNDVKLVMVLPASRSSRNNHDVPGINSKFSHHKRHTMNRQNSVRERYEYYEKLPPFGILDFVGCVLSILTYCADIGTDIFVAILYSKEERVVMFGLTVAFIVIPGIVTTSFSIAWYIQDSNYYKKYDIKISAMRWMWRVIFHIFQVGPILRYIDILRYGIKSRLSGDKNSRERRHYIEIMVNEDSDTALLRLLECFMESAPQLTLQLYILTSVGSDEIMLIRYGQGLACVTSLASLSWALTSYHRSLRLSLPEKAKMSYKGMILQFLWRFFTVGCRVSAFSLFASVYTFWVFVLAGCHWIVMFAGVLHQQTQFCDARMKNAKCQETLFDMVIAVVYIYCFLNINEGHTRLRYVIYYVIVYFENIGMALMWYMSTHTGTSWYLEPAMALIVGGFFLGIAFQIIYYLFFHPNNYPPFASKKRIKYCLKFADMMNKETDAAMGEKTSQVERNLISKNRPRNQNHNSVPSQFI